MSVTIYQGDCRTILSLLVPDKSVQTCVTSPPYFGLRDYGMAGQIGLEASVHEYVSKMVDVFRAVRECLTDDGTLWLNLGDSYAGSGRGGAQGASGEMADRRVVSARQAAQAVTQRGSRLPAGLHETARQEGAVGRAWVPPPGFKLSDLMGIPWRVAFALQADGWYLRQDIIWHKPNPMPESVTSRCTKAHEYIFLLSKNRKYYFDAEAIKEPAAMSSVARLSQPTLNQQEGSSRVPGKTNGKMKAVGHLPGNKSRKGQTAYEAGDEKMRTKAWLVDYCARVAANPELMMKRNKRSVWTVTTKPFKEAHFATFPPDLIEPCILAGSKPGDTVLDPFGGAGTTGLVATRHGRDAVLCELNPAYIEIAERRLA
jgi:DNA modification methylase